MQPNPRPGKIAIGVGIVSALISALITGFLLLINGALVMVLLASTATVTPIWMTRDGVLQFLLFSIPLVLVVLQWMLWDRIQGWFVREGRD